MVWELYGELTGESGEPVVFVHGSWTDHHAWDRVVPLLSPSSVCSPMIGAATVAASERRRSPPAPEAATGFREMRASEYVEAATAFFTGPAAESV